MDQQIEIRRHPDRDEEQPEQQTLERLDVGFELVAILAVCEQQSRDEGAERHAQAERLKEQGGTDDHE